MSWQERDYANPAGRAGGGWQRRPTGGLLRSYDIVQILIGVNVLIYILCTLTAGRTQWGILNSPLFQWGAMRIDLVMGGQIWRIITSDYLHWSFMHILFNMIGLYFFGRALLQVWGPKKFFLFYTVAGVVASLFYMALTMMGVLRPGIAAGASGCVLGLLGAAAVIFPRAEVLVYFLFPVRIRTVAIIIGIGYLLNVYSAGENAGGDACHIAGLVFGAWFAWRGDAWWSRSALRRVLIGTGRFGAASRRNVNPGGWARKMDRRRIDGKEVDRILKKVHEGGIHTLTREEKETLAAASDNQRQQDQQAKRGW